MLKTSYFSKIRSMSDEDRSRCVGIVAYMPEAMKKTMTNINKLAPNKKALWVYKENDDEEEYAKIYLNQLNKLQFKNVIEMIPKEAILCCFETPDKFCHRHILSQWLREHGVEIEEYY